MERVLTLDELSESQADIYVVVKAALAELGINPQPASPEPFIKGIHELAKFLRVSPAKAQKLKNEGAFEFWQDGRTVLFDPNKVRAAMNKQTK